ncbi:MAG: hypothetical protein KGL39_55705, partial [Patescibacteria group bacterium]|nr:hypothetical protein [Patescibacteria group bacterium]
AKRRGNTVAEIVRLVAPAPVPPISDGAGRVLDALRFAIKIVEDDLHGADVPPRGVVVAFLRERPDPDTPNAVFAANGYISAGVNLFEAIGLLTTTANDIVSCGLDGNEDCVTRWPPSAGEEDDEGEPA